jgi:LuxR family maltose regulon positive regulatory protein
VTSTAELADPVAVSTVAFTEPPVLSSKFAVPEPPRFMVARSRLLEQLTACVANPVTVVTGPASSGKTEAVASWVRAGRAGRPVAWVTLDEGDSGSGLFWTYLAESLRRAGVGSVPTAADGENHAVALRFAAVLADQPDTIILVLDEVSSIAGTEWADQLDFVLRHAAGRLRLVLVGRWDPPLPLYRYRLAGTLGEVRADDLAFTADEASELLTLHGIDLTPEGLASLLRHTEGWAAGLRLFAMALAGHADAESMLSTISGDEASIAEYFVREVLRVQPPEIREFLLKTSVLDTITPELAQLLTGRPDARRVLAALARENVFVQVLTDQPATYRYHRLFGELLRAELVCEEPGWIPSLHRRAAGWLAAEGLTVDAAVHAVAAGDWDTAAAIAVADYAVVQILLAERAGRLVELFGAMPDDVTTPEAYLIAAAVAGAGAQGERAATYLASAERLMIDAVPECDPATALSAAVLDGFLARSAFDGPRLIAAAHTAQALLDQLPPEHLGRHPELRAFVLAATGTAQSWAGSVAAAAARLTEAATAAAGARCPSLRLDCLQHLALLDAYRGRLRHAADLVGQAVEVAARVDTAGRYRTRTAEIVLAWVAAEHYDVEGGWRHLRAAEPLCEPAAAGLPEAGYALVKSRLLRARGEFRAALAVLQDISDDPLPAWVHREIALSRARILTATGHPRDALAVLERLPDPDQADSAVVRAGALHAAGESDQARKLAREVIESTDTTVPVIVAAWLTTATVAADHGEQREAADALRRALRLAEPESLRRCFREVGARLRRLMRDDCELAEHRRELGSPVRQGTLPGGQPGPEPAGPVIVEKLSKRELEVLRHVEAMMPTEEIAGAMYVSVNTVKTHVRSILRKLSASRRTEAVRRARELGLI